jgi:two-component system cell cycle sensor histidine kinase/response regulator CckA
MPAKRLLRDKDKKFRLLFEEHPQPMWIFDPESQKILEANPAAAALYGYSRDEFRAMPLADIQGPAHPAASAWRHRTASGRMIDVELAVHEIQYGGRKAELVVLMDITGRRHLEDQLRQAQKMVAVGMLAGGAAHDFNNLLAIITSFGQLILNNLAPDDPNRPAAQQILMAGERAAALTKQLLAFSRRRLQQPKVLDLNVLATGLGTMLQRLIGEEIELRLALLPDLGRVLADPGHIEQVLMNLVVNARDAMPDGGTLTIETANASLEPGPFVLLAVSDTGAGMDEATQARLFEPFFTTKSAGKGTGLGLSTVLGIVRQSGGALEVSSAPGRGTTVKVYLPRVDPAEG